MKNNSKDKIINSFTETQGKMFVANMRVFNICLSQRRREIEKAI